jgi:hypothetical protein
MSSIWCAVCGCSHEKGRNCPGELPATGPERHGWRVNVQTETDIEAFGVLVAPSYDDYRARILTYPNILWMVPGGGGTMKFVDSTAQGAERQAIDFIRRFCTVRGYTMRNEVRPVEVLDIPKETAPGVIINPAAERKVRFLPIRFGVATPVEIAGTRDLSESGIFIITASPVDSGDWLNMRLETKEEKLELRGQVRWMNKQHHVGRSPGMGVQLDTPPARYRTYVKTLAP